MPRNTPLPPQQLSTPALCSLPRDLWGIWAQTNLAPSCEWVRDCSSLPLLEPRPQHPPGQTCPGEWKKPESSHKPQEHIWASANVYSDSFSQSQPVAKPIREHTARSRRGRGYNSCWTIIKSITHDSDRCTVHVDMHLISPHVRQPHTHAYTPYGAQTLL